MYWEDSVRDNRIKTKRLYEYAKSKYNSTRI